MNLDLMKVYNFDKEFKDKGAWATNVDTTLPFVINGNNNSRKGRIITKVTTPADSFGDDEQSLFCKSFHGDVRGSVKPKTDSTNYKRWADAWDGYPAPGRINRVRFWIKFGPGIPLWDDYDGSYLFHFGTYCINSSAIREDGTHKNQEVNNGHFYHNYAPRARGQWHQFIVDDRPTHQRNASTSAKTDAELDAIKIPSPDVDPTYGYFDQMTTTYFAPLNLGDRPYLTAPPHWMHISSIEAYYDTSGEDNTSVLNPCGLYDSVDQVFKLGWGGRIEDYSSKTVGYEIRWSHSPVQGQSWGNLNPVQVDPVIGSKWDKDKKQMKGWDSEPGEIPTDQTVYFAMRAQNQPSGAFRQFVCPVINERPPI